MSHLSTHTHSGSPTGEHTQQRDPANQWAWEGAKLLFLALLCIPFLVSYAYQLSPDGGLYAAQGLNLAKAGYYGNAIGTPEVLRPPLFPFLISLFYRAFGVSVATSFLAPKLLALVAMWAIYLFGERLLGRWIGFVACLVVLAFGYVTSYLFGRLLLDGTQAGLLLLYLFFLASGLARQKYPYFVFAGLFVALGFLTKESAVIVVPLALIAVLLIQPYRTQRNLLGVFLMFVVFGLSVIWWWIYVYLESGEIFLVTSGRGRSSSLLLMARPIVFTIVTIVLGLTLVLGLRYRRQVGETVKRRQRELSWVAVVAGWLLFFTTFLVTSEKFTPDMASTYWTRLIVPLLQDNVVMWLILPAWIHVGVQALVRRSTIAKFLLLVGASFLPLMTVLFRWGNQPRNLLLLLIVSCLCVAWMITAMCGFVIRVAPRQIGKSWATLANAGVILAGLVSVIVTGSEFKYAQQSSIMDYNSKINLSVADCAQWFRLHAPAGATIAITGLYDDHFYFLIDGTRYHVLQLPFVTTNLTQLDEMHTSLTDNLAVFLRRSAISEWLQPYIFLVEDNFLDTLRMQRVDYVVVITSQGTGIAEVPILRYFEEAPSFSAVCQAQLGGNLTTIFEVDLTKLKATGVTYVDPTTVQALLDDAAHATPSRSAIGELERIGSKIRVWAMKPNEAAEVQAHIGDIYWANGGFEQAAQQYKWAQVLNPVALPVAKANRVIDLWRAQAVTDPWAALALGYYYRNVDNTSAMQLAYESALANIPIDPEFNLRLDKALAAANMTDQQIQLHAQLALRWQNSLPLLIKLSESLQKISGESELQTTVKQRILDLAPTDKRAMQILARFYTEAGALEAAQRIYDNLTHLTDDQATYRLAIGNMYLEANRFEEAMNAYEMAIAVGDPEPTSIVIAAKTLAKLGRTEDAVLLYQKLAMKKPSSTIHLQFGKLILDSLAGVKN